MHNKNKIKNLLKKQNPFRLFYTLLNSLTTSS